MLKNQKFACKILGWLNSHDDFLSGIKYIIIFSIIVFFVGFLIGFLVSVSVKVDVSKMDLLNASEIHSSMEKENNLYQELEETDEHLTFKIIEKNTRVLLIMIVGGTTLGLLTLIVLFINGAAIGTIFGSTLIYKGIEEMIVTAVLIIPHGVFEIPGILLAAAAGFKIPQVVIRYLKNGIFFTKKDLKQIFILTMWSIILIIIGGIIEANITTKIASLFIETKISV